MVSFNSSKHIILTLLKIAILSGKYIEFNITLTPENYFLSNLNIALSILVSLFKRMASSCEMKRVKISKHSRSDDHIELSLRRESPTQERPDEEEEDSSVSSETERSEFSMHNNATLFMLQFAIDQMSLEVSTPRHFYCIMYGRL